jgi:hypothetical protein
MSELFLNEKSRQATIARMVADGELWTIKQTMDRTRVCLKTIYNRMSTGQYRYVHHGNQRLIDSRSVVAASDSTSVISSTTEAA